MLRERLKLHSDRNIARHVEVVLVCWLQSSRLEWQRFTATLAFAITFAALRDVQGCYGQCHYESSCAHHSSSP
eukprot:2031687-Amphidinium_carterae.1